MNKKNRNVYFFAFGTKSFYRSFFYAENPDQMAKKFMFRWISMFWEKYAAKFPGSIKYEIDNDPEIFLSISKNELNPAGVVPFDGWEKIYFRVF